MNKVRPIYIYICLTLIISAMVGLFVIQPLAAAAEEGPEVSTVEAEEDPADGDIMPLAADSSFSGGDGSKEHPYEISSEADLRQLADNVNGGETYYGIHFKLTQDITLHGEWIPIGNYIDYDFNGIFDGCDHTIEGLTIMSGDSSQQYCGLFGSVDAGTIQKLTVKGNINTTHSTGGIVGRADSAEIINCSYEGTITMSSNWSYVGGIAGEVYERTKIINCRNKGNINGSGNSKVSAGGITGFAAGYGNVTEITGCSNEGSVSANGGSEIYAGGIAGWTFTDVTITDCRNTGSISAQYAGGIVGLADVVAGTRGDYVHCITTITNCLNENEVQNSSFWGEFVGEVSIEDGTDPITIKNCYYKSGGGKVVGSNEADADIDNVEAKSEDQFRSGELAYLMQSLGSWGQQLTGSKNSSPIPTNVPAYKVLKVIFFTDNNTQYIGYANPNREAEFMPEEPPLEGYLFYKWTLDGTIYGTELIAATAAGKDISGVYPTWQQPAIEGDVGAGVADGKLTVTSPTGSEYEYSLDDSGEWQDSPDFDIDGLTEGSHTVHVRRRSTADNIAPSESKSASVTVEQQSGGGSSGTAGRPSGGQYGGGAVTAPSDTSDTETVTVTVENKITGDIRNLTATRDGDTVTIELGKENDGLYANVYDTNSGDFVTASLIEDGKAVFTLAKGIKFNIVIDSFAHGEDVSADSGIYAVSDVAETAVPVVGLVPIAVSAVLIMKLRRKRNG